MNWKQSFDRALDEWRAAEEAFQQADPDFCDYHIYRLQAAEEKLGLIIRQAKSAYGFDSKKLPARLHWAALAEPADNRLYPPGPYNRPVGK